MGLLMTVYEGLVIPPIILHERTNADGKLVYEVVDGKQRLATLWTFIEGGWAYGHAARYLATWSGAQPLGFNHGRSPSLIRLGLKAGRRCTASTCPVWPRCLMHNVGMLLNENRCKDTVCAASSVGSHSKGPASSCMVRRAEQPARPS